MQTILKQLRSKYYKNGLSASARIGWRYVIDCNRLFESELYLR